MKSMNNQQNSNEVSDEKIDDLVNNKYPDVSKEDHGDMYNSLHRTILLKRSAFVEGYKTALQYHSNTSSEPIKDEELIHQFNKIFTNVLRDYIFESEYKKQAYEFGQDCAKIAKQYAASKLNNTIEDKWISVEEEYPKQYGNYLVQFITTVGEIEICVASFNEIPRHIFENPEMDKRWFVYPSAGHEIKPTHWQLLPKSSKI